MKRGFSFLYKKGDKASKTAFWLFAIFMVTTGFMVMVLVRIAMLPDNLFVEALAKAAAFYGFVQAIIAMLYHKGKNGQA